MDNNTLSRRPAQRPVALLVMASLSSTSTLKNFTRVGAGSPVNRLADRRAFWRQWRSDEGCRRLTTRRWIQLFARPCSHGATRYVPPRAVACQQQQRPGNGPFIGQVAEVGLREEHWCGLSRIPDSLLWLSLWRHFLARQNVFPWLKLELAYGHGTTTASISVERWPPGLQLCDRV